MPCDVSIRSILGRKRTARIGALLRKVVQAALAHQGAQTRMVSVLVTGDDEMRRLNLAWRKIDRTTDVLSFESGEDNLGDVVISLDQAERQAAELGVTVHEELARLAIHGTLHLLGHDHGTPAKLRAMEALTEGILANLSIDRR